LNNYFDTVKALNESKQTKGFLDNQLHQSAKNDFKYFCTRTLHSTFNNVNFQTVITGDSASLRLGDFLPLGADLKEGKVTFPKDLINIDDAEQFVAVVCYENGSVVDVYAFKTAEFKKTGMLSKFKEDAKRGTYTISLPGAGKLKQYSLGYVLKNIKEGNK